MTIANKVFYSYVSTRKTIKTNKINQIRNKQSSCNHRNRISGVSKASDNRCVKTDFRFFCSCYQICTTATNGLDLYLVQPRVPSFMLFADPAKRMNSVYGYIGYLGVIGLSVCVALQLLGVFQQRRWLFLMRQW